MVDSILGFGPGVPDLIPSSSQNLVSPNTLMKRFQILTLKKGGPSIELPSLWDVPMQAEILPMMHSETH